MLDWQVRARRWRSATDGIYRGAAARRQARDPGRVPAGRAHPSDGPLRAAGSLVRAELEAGRARSALRVRVTRQSDHLLATADWNGAQVARRAARLEAFDEMPFLAEALDRTGHDRVFEAALDRAVKLTAALVPSAGRRCPARGRRGARSRRA